MFNKCGCECSPQININGWRQLASDEQKQCFIQPILNLWTSQVGPIVFHSIFIQSAIYCTNYEFCLYIGSNVKSRKYLITNYHGFI